MSPLIKPKNIPEKTVKIITKYIGKPYCNIKAHRTPDKDKTEPTERSIPLDKITNVIPTAIIAFADVCCNMTKILLRVKKYSFKQDIKMIIRISVKAALCSTKTFFKEIFLYIQTSLVFLINCKIHNNLFIS